MPDKPPPRKDSSHRKAVALRYDQYREAPVLLGKGTGGAIAEKIIALARDPRLCLPRQRHLPALTQIFSAENHSAAFGRNKLNG
jgi:type III secretion system FlhB-like substrate exporter